MEGHPATSLASSFCGVCGTARDGTHHSECCGVPCMLWRGKTAYSLGNSYVLSATK